MSPIVCRSQLPVLALILGAMWPLAGHSGSDDLEQAMEPVLLGEQVLNAFENRQWDVIGNLEQEPGGSLEVELLQVLREMFSEPLHFTLAQRFPIGNGCQERRYAVRSGTAQGNMVLQVCPFDGGWRWTHLSFTPAPALTARFMFESQIAETLGIPAVYFLCEDDRYLDKGDVLRCEAGFVNRETALFGFRVHDDHRLEVVAVEIAGEDGPPTNEQVISAARGFLQPLLAGDLDQALRHTSAGFADPVSRLALREIARDLAADRGPLQGISQVGEQLNPGRLPPAYLFRLDFEHSSARVELELVAGEHMLKVHSVRTEDLTALGTARLHLISTDPDPQMQLHCPEIDMSKVGNEYPCELELWGQSMGAWIIVGEDQTINVRMSANLSARLARQLAGSERMLGWGFSRVDCSNNRPGGLDMVVCHVATSEGEKQLAVIYRGGTLRVVDIRDVE